LGKAQLEQKNQELFSTFQKAVKQRKPNYREVAATFESIDSDSIYKNRARDDHDRMRDEYTRRVVAQAQDLGRRGKCDELGTLEAGAREVWETAADAVAGVECRRPQAVTTTRPNNTVKTPPPDTTNTGT